jgi:hypothetical protein
VTDSNAEEGFTGIEDTSFETGLSGRRLVLVLYVIVVAIATFTGFVLGVIGPRDLDPQLFGFIAMPPTPLGMAAYGGITLATVLGVMLAAVMYVSGRYVGD